MDDILVCGLTDSQITALKKKHGFLVVVEIKQGETTLNAIFKEPTFEVLEATGAIGKNSEIKGTVALYENCIIKADDEINNRDFAKLKALEGLAQHMNSFSVGVKKLVARLQEGGDEVGTMQGDAIIMANFKVNPKELQVTQWGEYYAKAMWLERWRLENQAEMFRNLFGID